MKKFILFLCLSSIAAATAVADTSAEPRSTETSFAKAFADRDADTFFSYVADDASFVMQGGGVLNGKAAVVAAWSRLLKSKQAPFRWQPETVVVSGDGMLAFSTGPIFDPDGTLTGRYTSIWRRDGSGNWKVIFDGPGCPAQPEAPKKEASKQ